jgi:predicted AlkP superfamily pyrophosphatase or phosphodiesterase
MKSICLFLIDGCRSDGLAAANTPVIDRIIQRGAFTPSARSVMPSMTLPCHQSIFNGVPPERHGIVSNTFTPFVRPIKGLIQTVHQAGGKCAMFYNWEEMRDITPPGYLEVAMFARLPPVDKAAGDSAVAAMAAAWLASKDWNFAFVYFDGTDSIGHLHGWMSPQYLAAIEHADRCIGQVLPAIGDATVIVTADHGGHDKTHGTPSPEDMTIPFAIAGGDIPRASRVAIPFDLTCIAATICACLGIPPDPDWSGTAARFEKSGA